MLFLYSISYTLYPFIGLTTCLIVGILVSLVACKFISFLLWNKKLRHHRPYMFPPIVHSSGRFFEYHGDAISHNIQHYVAIFSTMSSISIIMSFFRVLSHYFQHYIVIFSSMSLSWDLCRYLKQYVIILGTVSLPAACRNPGHNVCYLQQYVLI
jgi:hypothetical protein